jgi:hypothetical protein
MNEKQEKKFEYSFDLYQIAHGKLDYVMKQMAKDFWIRALDANGIYSKQEMKPAFDDACKGFESLAYGLTRMSEKLSKAVDAGIEKANADCIKGSSLFKPSTGYGVDKETKHSAPDWVIEMMKTGKPVKCNVQNNIYKSIENIVGYDIKNKLYIAENGLKWINAEPITEWKPQIGEAVFARYKGLEGKYITVIGRVYKIKDDWYHIKSVDDFNVFTVIAYIKPFNASSIGKKWEEI